MKKILYIVYILASGIILFYVALPSPGFPAQLPNSLKSNEPADVESPLRRAYFTDMSRQEVLNWYTFQFKTSGFMNLSLPTYLLNYPPEESGTIIRDQTRSTFLQEIVHPFRETLYVNGYEPKPDDNENKIVINGTPFRQKIIVRYVPTNTFLRLLVALGFLTAAPMLFNEFFKEIKLINKK